MIPQTYSVKAVQLLLFGAFAAEGALVADAVPIDIDPSHVLQWVILALIGIVAFFVRSWMRQVEHIQQDVTGIRRELDRIEMRLDVVCPLWTGRVSREDIEKHAEEQHK